VQLGAVFVIVLGIAIAAMMPRLGRQIAPVGFDCRKGSAPHGKVETVEYDSKTVGIRRQMLVYTPPGYLPDRKYPVLYLLHGIADDERAWCDRGSADVILDNLFTANKAIPMILVMPNGCAVPYLEAKASGEEVFNAFAAFEGELLRDIIPYVDSHYSVEADPQNRALCGLSMGGGQSLNIGLKHPETFSWIGGFSSAPNTKKVTELVKDRDESKRNFRLLWISCGDQDQILNVSQSFHNELQKLGVAHEWHVDSGGHDWNVWKNDLYFISQKLFR
jgi:enterochelin esterase-like enzyme